VKSFRRYIKSLTIVYNMPRGCRQAPVLYEEHRSFLRAFFRTNARIVPAELWLQVKNVTSLLDTGICAEPSLLSSSPLSELILEAIFKLFLSCRELFAKFKVAIDNLRLSSLDPNAFSRLVSYKDAVSYK
jgi:hypothetical protein